MRIGIYICGLFLLFSPLNNAFGQGESCFPLIPYLDKNNQEIHDPQVCESEKSPLGGQSLNACWLASKNTCYWVGNPSQCPCIQQKGTVCNGELGNGDQYGYCKWQKGDQVTGCETWRLKWGLCNAPGYSIVNIPPNVEDFCRLLGGEVQGSDCINYYNNSKEKQPSCSLNDLWQSKCPTGNEISSPVGGKDSIPSEKTTSPLQEKRL